MIPHYERKRYALEKLDGVDVEGIVRASLATLVEQGTPRLVAKHLLDTGVRGWPGTAYTCPIAMYINRDLGITEGEYSVVAVDPGWVAVPYVKVRVSTPWEVAAFVRAFDFAPRDFYALLDRAQRSVAA